MLAPAVHLQRQHPARSFGPADAQHGLHALGQALLCVCAHLQAIDHHVDVVLLGFLQLGQVIDLVNLAIDAKAHIALGLHLLEQLDELALFLPRHRGQQHQLGVLGQLQHGVHHLADGLGRQGQAVIRAVRRASARVEQAQVVVDLGHRAHGGARVVAGGLLLDADRRRQALDQIDIGLVQPSEKLARIGREAFHIAALALGIQGVKRQAGLARARQPGDDDQPVARYVQVDVLQVVRACAADADAGRAQHLGQRAAVGIIGGGGGLGHGRGGRWGTHHDSHAGRASPTRRTGKTTLGENTGFA